MAGFTSLHIALSLMEALGEGALHPDKRHHDTIEECLKQFAARLREAIEKHHFADDDDRAADVAPVRPLRVEPDGPVQRRRAPRPKNFSDLDEMELREFLLKHGCRPESLTSPALTGYYDIAFAFADGINDDQHRNTGAGSAVNAMLQDVLRLQGLVHVEDAGRHGRHDLRAVLRGAEEARRAFKFFHKVKALEPSGDGRSIARVTLARQVDIAGGGEYRPLFDVPMAGGTLPCWPDAPFYEQLVQGEALKASGANLESDWSGWTGCRRDPLEAGTDFDHVVLGIPVGALKEICRPLLDAQCSGGIAVVRRCSTA